MFIEIIDYYIKNRFPWILSETKNSHRWFPMISVHGTEKLFSMGFEIVGLVDVFFLSPRKLSYAQKKILLKEIEWVPNNRPTQAEISLTSSIGTTIANHTTNKPAVEYFPQPTPPTGFLNRRDM